MEQKNYKNLVPLYLSGKISAEQINPVLKLSEKEIGIPFHILTPNDLTILFGPSGSGKSKICAFLIRQLLLRDTDDYFIRCQSAKEYKVVFIETEMSDLNVTNYYIGNNFYDFGKDDLNKILKIQERYEVIPFYNLTIVERNTKLREIVFEQKKLSDKFNIIFIIDNLGSFCEDLNSSLNNKLVNEFKSIFADFTVLAVLHSNHKEYAINKNNATGSIGTIAERLAQNVVQVDHPSSNIYTLQLKKSKTQDDKCNVKIQLTEAKIGNHLIFTEIKQSEVTYSKKNKERLSESEISNKLLIHLDGKDQDSPDRLMKSIEDLFHEFYGKSSIYEKIKLLKEKGIVTVDNGYHTHKDETPF